MALRVTPFQVLLLPGLRGSTAIVQKWVPPIHRQLCWEAWAKLSLLPCRIFLSWDSHAWPQPDQQSSCTVARDTPGHVPHWCRPGLIDWFPGPPQTFSSLWTWQPNHWHISDPVQINQIWAWLQFTLCPAWPHGPLVRLVCHHHACSLTLLGDCRMRPWLCHHAQFLASVPERATGLHCFPAENEVFNKRVLLCSTL